MLKRGENPIANAVSFSDLGAGFALSQDCGEQGWRILKNRMADGA